MTRTIWMGCFALVLVVGSLVFPPSIHAGVEDPQRGREAEDDDGDDDGDDD